MHYMQYALHAVSIEGIMHYALHALCIAWIMYCMHMHCKHHALYALCIACVMHCMHNPLHALCILCIMRCMHQAQSYSSCRYYTGILLSVIYFWISLRTDLLTNIATYRAAIAAKKRCVLLYLILSDSTLHDCITITLFYYCTFYYCTTPTENPCNKPTVWHY